MRIRHLLIGLGELGTRTVESTRERLVGLEVTDHPEILSIGLDLDRDGNEPVPSVSLRMDDLRDVLSNLDYRTADPSGWAKTVPWFPHPESFAVDPTSLDSTGQSRPIGRLAFEVFRPTVEAELRGRIDRLPVGRARHRVEISVVSSLTDGFGSGMVFDIAHLCRCLAHSAAISVYLALPEPPDTHRGSLRRYQNSFAALRELRLFASQPHCFHATWDGVSVFSPNRRRGVLDQVYFLTTRLRRQTSQVDPSVGSLARILAQRCQPRTELLRRRLLAEITEAHFRRQRASSEPTARRAHCELIRLVPLGDPIKVRQAVQRVFVEKTGAVIVGGVQVSELPHLIANKEHGEWPASAEGPGDPFQEDLVEADIEFLQRIDQFLRDTDLIPQLHKIIDDWRKLVEDQGTHSQDDRDRLSKLDKSLVRLGQLFFEPWELSTSERQKLLYDDLDAKTLNTELDERAGRFLDEAKTGRWGNDSDLQAAFRRCQDHLENELESSSRRPGRQRLFEQWEEMNRFQERLEVLEGTRGRFFNPMPLVQRRNRLVRLAILAQAKEDLDYKDRLRSCLRFDAVHRLAQKLKGMGETQSAEFERPENTDSAEETSEEQSAIEAPELAVEDEKAVDEEVENAVRNWRRQGHERDPTELLQRLREVYRNEGRLLIYSRSDGLLSALEQAFEACKEASPFATRIPPDQGWKNVAPEILVVISIPQSLFWPAGPDDLKHSIADLAQKVLGHINLRSVHIPGLDDLWVYVEEIGRPLHQLRGIEDLRAAYECHEDPATLHIDAGLLGLLPDWPVTRGPEPTPCPSTGDKPGIPATEKGTDPGSEGLPSDA